MGKEMTRIVTHCLAYYQVKLACLLILEVATVTYIRNVWLKVVYPTVWFRCSTIPRRLADAVEIPQGSARARKP